MLALIIRDVELYNDGLVTAVKHYKQLYTTALFFTFMMYMRSYYNNVSIIIKSIIIIIRI